MTALLLDMDGVLYLGDRALPGAREFVAGLARHPHLFITNNPTRSPPEVAQRLSDMGFGGIHENRILTSAEATALWLGEQKPAFRYFALDYDTLTTGINLVLWEGARLVATNPDSSVDAWHRGRRRVLPGGGALMAPFEVATPGTPRGTTWAMHHDRRPPRYGHRRRCRIGNGHRTGTHGSLPAWRHLARWAATAGLGCRQPARTGGCLQGRRNRPVVTLPQSGPHLKTPMKCANLTADADFLRKEVEDAR